MRLIEPGGVLSHTPGVSQDAHRTGKMNRDIRSEILSRNLSSFLKLRTHSQHLKMDVHNWSPIYIFMFSDIDNLL